jgi:hypothetical protein
MNVQVKDGQEEGNFDVLDETLNNGNSQNGESINGKPDTDELTYKERYANSTKEYQKIAEEKNQLAYDKEVYGAYRQVLKDNSHLLSLDPKVAEDVVKQLFEDWLSNTDDLKELLDTLGIEQKEKSKPLNEDEIVKNVRAKILEEQQEEKANEVLKETLSNFDKEKQAQYLKEFKEVLWQRKPTPEFAKKEIEKIILYYNKESIKKEKSDNILSNMASNGIWTKWEGNDSWMTIAKLKWLWVPDSQQRKLYPNLFTK